MTGEKNKVILHADDEPAHAVIIRMAFQRNVGNVQLIQVEDGKVTLDYLYRRGIYEDPTVSLRPDLILLDLNMPHLGGLEVLATIKKDPELQTIPVVVLTTSDLLKDRSAAHANGVDGYLIKPGDFSMCVDMIDKLCLTWL